MVCWKRKFDPGLQRGVLPSIEGDQRREPRAASCMEMAMKKVVYQQLELVATLEAE